MEIGCYDDHVHEGDVAESMFETRILQRDLETSRLLSINL